jgi:hypothetical protein
MDNIIRPKKKRPSLTVVDNTATPFRAQESPKEIVEPTFIPPEEVAENEIASKETFSHERTKKIIGKHGINLHMPRGKKQWLIIILVLFFVLSGGVSAYWFGIHKSTKPVVAVVQAPIVKKTIPPAPTTEVSKMSGLEVPVGTNLKPVTAVMIENSPDARPQSGLKDASVIFEAVAEGGITRFNALFQETIPDYIGPIRSVRPYYIDWFWPFDASIAHVGGAPQALSDIKSLGIKDLDQFYNSGSYDRITSRYAPHNVYTSIARLNDLEKNKGFTSANYTGFVRKKEAIAATSTAKTIDLNLNGYFYNVHYNYDITTNSYLRSEGGAVHKDDKSGLQLAPKVVVAIVMGRGTDGDGEHTDYTTTGSGHMFVFQDSTVIEGTWAKTSRQAQWTFTTADGKALAFNPGQTWFTMVDSPTAVTYAP